MNDPVSHNSPHRPEDRCGLFFHNFNLFGSLERLPFVSDGADYHAIPAFIFGLIKRGVGIF